MTREDILATIRANEARLRELSVRELALFGSFVRGDATDASDIDFLVEFDEKSSTTTLIPNTFSIRSSAVVSTLAARAISSRDCASGF